MLKYRLEQNIPFNNIENIKTKYSLEVYYVLPRDKQKKDQNIDELDILYPPIFVFENSHYWVVLGKKYIDKFITRKRNIPFGLVVEKGNDEYEFLKYLVRLKKESKGFNTIEKSVALKKISETTNRVSDDILSLLEIPKNEKYIENYLKLFEACDEIKQLILQGVLHENTLFEIFKLTRLRAELSLQLIPPPLLAVLCRMFP